MRSSLLVHNIIYKVIICTMAENRITYLQKASSDGAKGTIYTQQKKKRTTKTFITDF